MCSVLPVTLHSRPGRPPHMSIHKLYSEALPNFPKSRQSNSFQFASEMPSLSPSRAMRLSTLSHCTFTSCCVPRMLCPKRNASPRADKLTHSNPAHLALLCSHLNKYAHTHKTPPLPHLARHPQAAEPRATPSSGAQENLLLPSMLLSRIVAT